MGRAILGIEHRAYTLSYILRHFIIFLLWDRLLLSCPGWAPIFSISALAAECWDYRHVVPCSAHIVSLCLTIWRTVGLSQCLTSIPETYKDSSFSTSLLTSSTLLTFLQHVCSAILFLMLCFLNYENYSNKWDIISHGSFELPFSNDLMILGILSCAHWPFIYFLQRNILFKYFVLFGLSFYCWVCESVCV